MAVSSLTFQENDGRVYPADSPEVDVSITLLENLKLVIAALKLAIVNAAAAAQRRGSDGLVCFAFRHAGDDARVALEPFDSWWWQSRPWQVTTVILV